MARDVVPLGVLDIIGFTTWVIGFGIEVISDKQKSWFNADPKNKGHWIDVGLWKFSRHPNCECRRPSPPRRLGLAVSASPSRPRRLGFAVCPTRHDLTLSFPLAF